MAVNKGTNQTWITEVRREFLLIALKRPLLSVCWLSLLPLVLLCCVMIFSAQFKSQFKHEVLLLGFTPVCFLLILQSHYHIISYHIIVYTHTRTHKHSRLLRPDSLWAVHESAVWLVRLRVSCRSRVSRSPTPRRRPPSPNNPSGPAAVPVQLGH